MLISDVLKKKGNTVLTILASANVSDAIAEIASHKVGAIIVVDAQGQTVGIFTERDVVRIIHKFGPDVLTKPVSEVMTANPITCVKTDDAEAVLATMSTNNFRHMPVFEGGALCGIVSIRDLVVERLQVCETEAKALRDYVTGV